MIERLRRLRVVLIVLGAALMAVGALGLALGWGSSDRVRHRAGSATTTSTTGAPSTATTVAKDELPQTFFDTFVNALRNGDRAFLLERMHPAVIARYGSTQCEAFTAKLLDPAASLRLAQVGAPAAYDYASDGRSISIANTYTFTVDGTVGGNTGSREYHFALVDGRFRIFADCGDPVGASS